MDSAEDLFVDSQLRYELRRSVADSLGSRRPILTHLNADTSWLLSIPVPDGNSLASAQDYAQEADKTDDDQTNGRNYFHILIDPWLKGPQADVTRFLSQQWHKETSAIQSIDEVSDIIVELEELAHESLMRQRQQQKAALPPAKNKKRDHQVPRRSVLSSTKVSRKIDLVVVSHEFTDHMHKETLFEVDSSVPVFATSVAAGRIRAWKHFHSVTTMPRFSGKGSDWRSSSLTPLPAWLSVVRLDSSQSDLLNYHSAVMVTFKRAMQSTTQQKPAEAVIYTPHGITAEQLAPVATSEPTIQTLALIHTMHDITLSGAQLNLGAHNGLKAQRLTRAKYWVGTHDEIKTGYGLVSWVLRRKVITLEEALKLEIEASEGKDADAELEALAEVHFADLKNGETLVLY